MDVYKVHDAQPGAEQEAPRCPGFEAPLDTHGGFPDGSVVKNPSANAGATGDSGSIPRSGRSPGDRNGNPFQYSCLGNLTDIGAWWAIVHGSQSPTAERQTLRYPLAITVRAYDGMLAEEWHPSRNATSETTSSPPCPIPGLVPPMDSSQESSVWLLVPVSAYNDSVQALIITPPNLLRQPLPGPAVMTWGWRGFLQSQEISTRASWPSGSAQLLFRAYKHFLVTPHPSLQSYPLTTPSPTSQL